jgi:hypothetical protein
MPKIYYIKTYHHVTHVIQKILEETQREFQKTKFRFAYFLPFGKAHDTAIPSLPRVRGSLLQRHPWTPWTYGILSFCNVRVYNINLNPN